MNPLLNRIGEALFGEHWRAPLSSFLGVNERTIRRWIGNEVAVPPGVWKDIFVKLDAQRDEVEFLITQVKGRIDEAGEHHSYREENE